MHTTIDYRNELNADEKAVADIRAWCSDKQWSALCEMRDGVLSGDTKFAMLAFALGFVGVSGFPVHAFGRTFCPIQWQDWYDQLD